MISFCCSPLACFCWAVMPTIEKSTIIFAIVTLRVDLSVSKSSNEQEDKSFRSMNFPSNLSIRDQTIEFTTVKKRPTPFYFHWLCQKETYRLHSFLKYHQKPLTLFSCASKAGSRLTTENCKSVCHKQVVSHARSLCKPHNDLKKLCYSPDIKVLAR